jgi:hypothetical protein
MRSITMGRCCEQSHIQDRPVVNYSSGQFGVGSASGIYMTASGETVHPFVHFHGTVRSQRRAGRTRRALDEFAAVRRKVGKSQFAKVFS